MIKGSSPVKSDQKELGDATYPVYETVDEAVNHPEFGLGEPALLDLLNAQVKTNAMNQLRTAKTKGPTKTMLRAEATSEIVEEIGAGQHGDAIGNRMVLEALIERRMAEIEARMTAGAPVAAE